MKRIGLAIGNFRADSVKWDSADLLFAPRASEARKQMEERQSKSKITDEIVDSLGGNKISEYQAAAYKKIIDDIKSGLGTNETSGSMADAARKRMIERDNSKYLSEGHPDIGNDMANRLAYPEGSGPRRDSADENADRSSEKYIERSKAFANAGCM